MPSFATLLRSAISRVPGGRRLRAEVDHLEQQRRRLQTRVEAAERRRVRLLERFTTVQRRAASRELDPAVLRGVVGARLAALQKHDATQALAREHQFTARSERYGTVLASGTPSGSSSTSIDGLTWWAPGSQDAETTGRATFQRELPFEEILQARELAVGHTMIDIGANIGMMSIPRVALGDFQYAYAAEPDERNYHCLLRNVVDNGLRGRVLPDHVAIGDRNEDVWLRQASSGTHHLLQGEAGRAQARRVAGMTLDTWLNQLGIDSAEITFVKCDTQGWEARVMAGAPGVLACRHIAWQIEFSPSMLERAGTARETMFALIRAHFSHFIDLRGEQGQRRRRSDELQTALDYVGTTTRSYTNLLLFNQSA